ncbi:MAG: chemotaxis protein CheX [Myxococcales bacterium]|nr:chemotaxis protein CheX [Myxococcales bacterium]
MGSLISQNQLTIEAITTTACTALFADYDMEIREASDPGTTGSVHYCGIIGFTGDRVRGTLLLAMGEEALRLAMPEGAEVGDSAHRNWISELSNQLLGRIKNMLLRREAEVYLTMPLALRGEHLSPLPRERSHGLHFESDGGPIRLWVDAEFIDDFILPTEDVAGSEEVPEEGEAMLF